jgi:hypothetical protein
VDAALNRPNDRSPAVHRRPRIRAIHVTGPLSVGTPRAIGADASSYPSLVSLLVGFIAIAPVVASF